MTMNSIYKLIICITILFCEIVFGQISYAPIELGNIWVYEIYDGTLRRAEIVDSSVIIDSIKYYGVAFAYQKHYSDAIRLREDDFYVIKVDSSSHDSLNERRYYKRNAQLGDACLVGAGGLFGAAAGAPRSRRGSGESGHAGPSPALPGSTASGGQ